MPLKQPAFPTNAGESLNYTILNHPEFLQTLHTHLSECTAENAMKPSNMYTKFSDPNGMPTNPADFNFTAADNIINNICQGMGIHGHTLIWADSQGEFAFLAGILGKTNPETGVNYTPKDVQKIMKSYISIVVGHFKGNVNSWDVTNEIFSARLNKAPGWAQANTDPVNDPYEYIRLAFEYAHQADPRADLYMNESEPGEVVKAIDAIKHAKIKADGIGLQGHLFNYQCNSTPLYEIDPVKGVYANVFDKASKSGLRSRITEAESVIQSYVVGRCGATPVVDIHLNPDLAEAQKKAMYDLTSAYLENVPEGLRGGITFWGLTDRTNWNNASYNVLRFIYGGSIGNGVVEFPSLFSNILNENYITPNPSFTGFVDAILEDKNGK